MWGEGGGWESGGGGGWEGRIRGDRGMGARGGWVIGG